MKKIVALIFLLTCVANAITRPKWVQIAISHDLDTTLVDTAHVSVVERTASVWTLVKYSKPQYENYNIKSHTVVGSSVVISDSTNNNTLAGAETISQMDGDNSSYVYNIIRVQTSYDCLNRFSKTITQIRYFNDSPIKNYPPEKYWQIIIPGTLGASIYNLVCPDDSDSYKQNKIVESVAKNKQDIYPVIVLPMLLFILGAGSAIYLTVHNMH